jgi:hypothetical protein
MVEWRYRSTSFDLGTRRRCVVSLSPQSRYGRCGEEENLAPAGNGKPSVQAVALRYTG